MGDQKWNIPDDRLPTTYESVMAVISVAPTHGTRKQQDTIHDFSVWLHELWTKSFSKDNVLVLKTVKTRLVKHLKDYASSVQKRKGSKRMKIDNWKKSYNPMVMFDLKREDKNADEFPERERNFYYDQLSLSRRWALSREVDTDYEDERAAHEMEVQENEEAVQNEIEFIMEVDDETLSATLPKESNDPSCSYAVNRSGKVRLSISHSDASTQTEGEYVLKTDDIQKKSLRKGNRNFHDSIKIALASSCAAANISPEQSRKAFQATSEIFFGMKYYLSPDDVPSDTSEEASTSKKPRTKEEYQSKYKDVIPSKKTIGRVKHLMALQEERNAALAILDAMPKDVLTIHYDTTTRRRLNGEWPSLILKMSNGKKFRLRSLSMAVEDRKNIVKLFVVTLNRLAITVNTDRKVLWEKVTALMTDSVTKNLQIENMIAATIFSNHIPLHLLCVSHTCEAFDAGNLQILRNIERSLKLSECVLSHLPSLRTFISNGIAHAALKAYSKLVNNDGHKSSLYEEFDAELSRNNRSKKFSIFKERRFALLGYSAAAAIHHKEDIVSTLSCTNSQNKLVQACRLYSQMDYVTIALSCIAWFTYKVTFPFLNMCEIETTTKLLEILPRLQNDLYSNKMDTLNEYSVNYSFEVKEPTTPLGKIILSRFNTRAADDLGRQRGREFGFSTEPKRATDLTQVPSDICDKLPDHNLDCERDLSVMDKIAIRAASCSNRKFTGKCMRDDMTLFQAKVVAIDDTTKKIAKLLDRDEQSWFEEQAELTKEKIAKRKDKALHRGNYIHTLLSKCKDHGGPFVTIDELEQCLMKEYTDDELRRILRREILFRKHTSLKDFHANPALYKVNKMPTVDMKVNLAILLGDDHMADVTDDEPGFPNEDAMMKCLAESFTEEAVVATTCVDESVAEDVQAQTPIADESTEIAINEPCIVVWDMPNGREWFLGFVRSQSTGGYVVDHLEQVPKTDGKMYWRYPKTSDEHEVETMQIIPCNVIGAWDRTKNRRHTFELSNWEIIEGLFRSLYE